MSTAAIQALVDALGERLRRQVTVEDHTLQLVAFSKHYGDLDTVRIWSLMERRSRPDETYYASARNADEPFRVPAVPEIDQRARLCVPIRHDTTLLGFLWLIDADSSLTDAEIADTQATAAELGGRLHEQLVVRDTDDLLSATLLGQLTDADSGVRAGAAAEVLARGYLRDDAYVGAIDLSLDTDADPGRTLAETVAIEVGRIEPGTTLRRTSTRGGTVVLATARDLRTELYRLADLIAKAVEAALPAAVGANALHVGVSGVGHGLGDVASTIRQAGIARKVARRRSGVDGDRLVRWADLGPYKLIAQLPADAVDDDLLPRGLVRLLRASNTHDLVITTEVFCDLGGDKQRAARRLNIHRSTMYYRLEQVEQITGLDLDDGRDRLLVHMAIKLHRLAPLPDRSESG